MGQRPELDADLSLVLSALVSTECSKTNADLPFSVLFQMMCMLYKMVTKQE